MRERLNKLHDEENLSWRKIAQMDEYKGIPAGSLCSFAGGWEPRTDETRKKFGLPTVEMIPQVRNSSGRFSKRGNN